MAREINPIYLRMEAEIARAFAAEHECEWGRFGQFSPVDVYFRRGRDVVAFAEIRTLDRDIMKFDCVWLDIDKWFHMNATETALGLPAYYIMGMRDAIWYFRIGDIPVREFKKVWTGNRSRQGFVNDVCPTIQVPREYLFRLCHAKGLWDELDISRSAANAA